MPQETPAVKLTRVINATAAGTSAVNGAIIDMADFEGVQFVVALGALTATQVTSLKAQHGDAANLSDAADMAGTLTGPALDADSNKTLVLDVNRPTKRYIRVVVNRATANAVIDSGMALQYGPKKKPTTNDATTTSATKSVVSPAAGTP